MVRNFDPEQTTSKLLKELCMQAGPVRNVVMRPDHAFVEFDDFESVGYSKALLDGIVLFGRPLSFEPKIRLNEHFRYVKSLDDYKAHAARVAAIEQQRQLQMQYQMQMPPQLGYNNYQYYRPPPQIVNYNQQNQFQYQPPQPPNSFY